MPKVSQEHTNARRAQILAGAQRAFARHGYEGATVARLEEETGLSRGAIFNYFSSKQDLFAALAVDVNRRYTDAFLTGGLDEVVHTTAREDPDLIAVVLETETRLRHNADFVKQMDAAAASDTPRLAEWFASRQGEGAIRSDLDPIDLARFATMVVNGLALRVLAGDDTNVDTVLRLLHDALAPRQ